MLINGDDGNNVLIGTVGADVIDGKGGNDDLRGGAGADLYKFGNSFGVDEVKETAGNGIDTLQILATVPASAVRLVGTFGGNLTIFVDGQGAILLDNHLSDATVEKLQIGGGGPISLTGGLSMTGNGTNETIYGTTFNDTITGGAGSDDLRGGTGGDLYRFGDSFGADEVKEDTGAGIDTLQILATVPASAVRLVGTFGGNLTIFVDGEGSILLDNHLVGATVEKLQIGGAGPILLTGGLSMTGSSGAETIYGTTFDDTINGGTGNDDLRGEAGDDDYRFTGSFGQDRISDTSGHNEVVFTDLAQAQLTLSNVLGTW